MKPVRFLSVLYLAIVMGAGTPSAVVQAELREEFTQAWQQLPGQQRAQMVVDLRLQQAAQVHADELCYRELVLREPHGYSLHRGLDGSMPNDRVRRAGYPLPDIYAAGVNYVESVAVTHLGPSYALALLMSSPSHAAHLAAEYPFFAEQVRIGVGVACGAWYVAVSAPVEGSGVGAAKRSADAERAPLTQE